MFSIHHSSIGAIKKAIPGLIFTHLAVSSIVLVYLVICYFKNLQDTHSIEAARHLKILLTSAWFISFLVILVELVLIGLLYKEDHLHSETRGKNKEKDYIILFSLLGVHLLVSAFGLYIIVLSQSERITLRWYNDVGHNAIGFLASIGVLVAVAVIYYRSGIEKSE